MKQKLILLALVIGLTIVSQSSLSLGMGKIQVYSALNEPLRSSIDLITNADEELENLEVRLASSDDYQKVGLDKSFVPANIMVAFDADNPLQINLTSNGPVNEPIVSLLLDVNWNNGRILREFTILLDPPVYQSNNLDVQVNSVVVDSIAEETAIEPVTEPMVEDTSSQTVTYTNEDAAAHAEPAKEIVEVEPEPDYSSYTDEVTVQAGDTLWSIANNNKVGDLTTHQMVMAIYNANPSAFIDNNINQLIKGSRLNMPSVDDVRSIGHSEALAQVRSHNQSWSPARQDYASIQTETTTEDSYEAPASSLDYGVQLSGSDAGDSDNGQTNADETSSETAMAMEEDLLTTETENAELKERISELEDIVDQQQEVLEVSDDGLANLENQLANVSDEAEEDVDDAISELTNDANQLVDETVDAAENTGDDIWDALTSDEANNGEADNSEGELNLAVEGVDSSSNNSLDTDTADETVDDTAAGENATEKTAVTKSVVPRKPEPSFIEKSMSWVMGNLMWVLIGLAALLALIFVPRLLGGSDAEDEDGTSFLDDIKKRNQDQVDDSEDSVDTKMNQPLMDDEPIEAGEVEDDVLAELDRNIDFDDDEAEDVADEDSADIDMSLDEQESSLEEADDGGFDLDGFLNDDDEDKSNDISDTVDHSETLAGVSFDEENAAEEAVAETDELEDFDLDDFELDEELSDDAAEVVEDLAEEADETIEQLAEDIDDSLEDMADEVTEAAELGDDDFSFDDDEAFDFDLDEELEELEQAEDITLSSEVENAAEEVIEEATDVAESLEDEFNDMVDIADDATESFETHEEDNEDELDLGLEDLMEESDAIGTKLDLAKAYIDMGDAEGAKNLLDEVFAEGNEEQIADAKKLLDDM